MRNVRIRVWSSGAFIAAERDRHGSVTKVLEFDGRQRYHAVAIRGREWSETELRFDNRSRAAVPSFFLNHTRSEGHAQILTEWEARSLRGDRSFGKTLIHPDNNISWSQQTRRDGITITAQGDGFSRTRIVTDSNGQDISTSTQHSTAAPNLRSSTTTVKHEDGTQETNITRTKPSKDGGQLTRTDTIQKDASGQTTNQTSNVSKQNSDGSSQTQTTSTDTLGGTTTVTNSSSTASQTITNTVVTDNNTGQNVTTSDGKATGTDNQGNTITLSGTSVTSSDGFSSS